MKVKEMIQETFDKEMCQRAEDSTIEKFEILKFKTKFKNVIMIFTNKISSQQGHMVHKILINLTILIKIIKTISSQV